MAYQTIQERFLRFHSAHPEVYEGLCTLARKAKAKGRNEYGIARLWEVLRWNAYVEGDAKEEFKLSNSFRSRYSRLIMEKEADLQDFFTTRELRTA